MKNYFRFNLTGAKFAPIFYLFYVTLLIPMGLLVSIIVKYPEVFMNKHFEANTALEFVSSIALFLLLMVIPTIINAYFVNKTLIEGVEYEGKQLEFHGTFGDFLIKILVGTFLSIVTLGVYSPWFIRNMNQYFVGNTAVDQDRAKFNGKGGRLFLIITFTLIIPYIVISIINQGLIVFKDTPIYLILALVVSAIRVLITAPFYYLNAKWYVDLEYKGFKVLLNADMWEGIGVIIIQSLLSILSFGIYAPAAYLKVYKYFAERVTATSDEKIKIGGYDLESKEDFKFIWKNILLIIVTLGIYYPWGYCNIMSRVASKTYLQEV